MAPTPTPTDAPGTRSPVFYLTLQHGLFQGVPRACSERLSPTCPPKGVCPQELSPKGSQKLEPWEDLAHESRHWLSPASGA